MKKPKKIAYLKTIAESPEYLSKFGKHSNAFRNWLGNQDLLEIIDFDAYLKQYPEHLEDFDGFIVPGSKYSVYDDYDWIKLLLEKIREIEALKIPLLGICFGHQAISLALGGKVEQKCNKKLNAGLRDIYWKNSSKNSDFISRNLHSVKINMWHRDEVLTMPPGAVLLGYDSEAHIQSYHIENHVLAFQCHPEFSSDIIRFFIDTNIENLTEKEKKDILATLHENDDSHIISDIVIRFFMR